MGGNKAASNDEAIWDDNVQFHFDGRPDRREEILEVANQWVTKKVHESPLDTLKNSLTRLRSTSYLSSLLLDLSKSLRQTSRRTGSSYKGVSAYPGR